MCAHLGSEGEGTASGAYDSVVTGVAMPDDLHELEKLLLVGIGSMARDTARSPSESASTAPLSQIFTAQVESRVLDHSARWLRAQGHGYYTIGSSGHEGNAAVAAALRLDRPGTAALSLWRVLLRPRPAATRTSGGARRAGRDAGADRGSDLRRAPQGVRAPRPRCDPTDLDDRLAVAARARRGVRDRQGASTPAPTALARRCARGVLASAMPAPTTRPPRARSTPPATYPTAACRSRCCWCVRTTGSGSASRPRRAGSKRRSVTDRA